MNFTISLRLADACATLAPRVKRERLKHFSKRYAEAKNKSVWIVDVVKTEKGKNETYQHESVSLASQKFCTSQTSSIAIFDVLHMTALYIVNNLAQTSNGME